jgi:DNA-binding MarR family transcriptional regulator
MAVDNMVGQARFILATGKLIQDRVFKIQSAHLAAGGKRRTYGDLSVPQLYAIMRIRQRGPLSMKELADVLDVTPPSASAMVDRLVEKGILVREPGIEDRRKVMVQVSPEALKDMQQLEKAILRSFVQIVEQIGPATARKWCEVLDRVYAVLVKEDGGPSAA